MIRPEVVELLVSASQHSVFPYRLAHEDGSPYTREEQALADSSTDEEREIARKLIDAHADHARRQEADLTAVYDIARGASVPPGDGRAWRTAVEAAGQRPASGLPALPEAEAHVRYGIATIATAFRARILPHLAGEQHGHGLDCLDRLDPRGTSDSDRAELEEYRSGVVKELWNVQRLLDQYAPDGSTPLEGFWDRIPEVNREEIRAAFRRHRWAIPGEDT